MPGKKERFLTALERWGAVRCTCGRPMEPDGTALRCAAGHTVDINRKGCVNLLSRQAEGCYDARLFASRSRVFSAGCYEPVAQAIMRQLPGGAKRILDAGCGDGWYLNRLLREDPALIGMGIDISRDAILKATDHPSPAVWCVADLRCLPVMDGSVDAILDILTPAGYNEFRRVLAPGGVLIKVYPGRLYLRQIREARGLPLYEEGRVDAFLREHGSVVSEEHVLIDHPVDAALWSDFIYMTPLNQDLGDEEKQRLAAAPAACVTIDLHVTGIRFSP